MREIKTCPDLGWQQLPTEELDQILQVELEKEHPNEEVVLPILHELEEREKSLHVEKTPEVIEISQKLGKYETSSKQSIHRRRWLTVAAAAVAVVCIVVIALPQTVGAESFIDVLFRWTSSIFEFIDPDKSYPNADGDFATNNPGLQQLYDKVTELGVTELVVPMWLPENYVLSELKNVPISGGEKVYGAFVNGSKAIVITYQISSDIAPKVEKEETGFELFEFREISHFIVENDDTLSVTWTVDGVKCLLNANVAKDDLYNIIKSVYRSELTR